MNHSNISNKIVQIKSRLYADERPIRSNYSLKLPVHLGREICMVFFLPWAMQESIPGGMWVLLSEVNIQHNKFLHGFPLMLHREKKTKESVKK